MKNDEKRGENVTKECNFSDSDKVTIWIKRKKKKNDDDNSNKWYKKRK